MSRRLTSRQLDSLRAQRRRKKRDDSLLLPQVGSPDSLRVTMSEYLEWCQVQQCTPATVHTRADALQVFALWCDARSLSRPSEVTRPILERYQRHLFLYRKANGRPLGAGTQQGRLVCLKGYFKWLTKSGRLAANPAADLEIPRRPKHLPLMVLSPLETEAILAKPDVSTPEGLRDRAMLEVLYSTGMRRAELGSLTVFSINGSAGTVAIFEGKGRKDRVVPIGERALAWVQKYVDKARPRLAVEPDTGVLFLTVLGAAFHPNRLTEVVRGYVKASGVAPRGACHLFRHAMATQMLENGADVRYLQAMLGHASLETTQIYTHVSIRKLKEIHTAAHPAARLTHSGAPRVDVAEHQALLDKLNAELDEER